MNSFMFNMFICAVSVNIVSVFCFVFVTSLCSLYYTRPLNCCDCYPSLHLHSGSLAEVQKETVCDWYTCVVKVVSCGFKGGVRLKTTLFTL